MSNCRSCGAPVVWCITSAGKLMPIDTAPVPNGNVRITDEMRPSKAGTARLCIVLPLSEQGELVPDTEPRYVSHFATCPNAEEHRTQ